MVRNSATFSSSFSALYRFYDTCLIYVRPQGLRRLTLHLPRRLARLTSLTSFPVHLFFLFFFFLKKKKKKKRKIKEQIENRKKIRKKKKIFFFVLHFSST